MFNLQLLYHFFNKIQVRRRLIVSNYTDNQVADQSRQLLTSWTSFLFLIDPLCLI